MKKKKETELEKRSSSPLLHCNTERWSYYPENLTALFFHFLSWSSRNTELLLRPEYLDRTPVTRSDVEREEKTNAPGSKVHRPLFLSCITPNWCSCETANGRLGAEVQLRVEILEQWDKVPSLPPRNRLKHSSWFQLMTVRRLLLDKQLDCIL